MTGYLDLLPEVGEAVAAGRPVVALESSIIAQGLPYPQSVETALAAEERISELDAVPATIAILEGRIRIGLRREEIEDFATGRQVRKLSRGDLAVALATGETGATTVAATMICAHAAGIKVFATGGIGGVHRLAEHSFDISRDLHELAETPVIVVSAGAKSVLDLPKTLEVLETLGVPAITIGQDGFPAFWSRNSGLASPLRIDNPEQVAAAQLVREELGLAGGMLVANPIPEAAEIPFDLVQNWVDDAVEAAERAGITGKQLTPHLLTSIAAASGGASLVANRILVEENARMAARIATGYSRLCQTGR